MAGREAPKLYDMIDDPTESPDLVGRSALGDGVLIPDRTKRPEH
jgi:hypothetical protein